MPRLNEFSSSDQQSFVLHPSEFPALPSPYKVAEKDSQRTRVAKGGQLTNGVLAPTDFNEYYGFPPLPHFSTTCVSPLLAPDDGHQLDKFIQMITEELESLIAQSGASDVVLTQYREFNGHDTSQELMFVHDEIATPWWSSWKSKNDVLWDRLCLHLNLIERNAPDQIVRRVLTSSSQDAASHARPIASMGRYDTEIPAPNVEYDRKIRQLANTFCPSLHSSDDSSYAKFKRLLIRNKGATSSRDGDIETVITSLESISLDDENMVIGDRYIADVMTSTQSRTSTVL